MGIPALFAQTTQMDSSGNMGTAWGLITIAAVLLSIVAFWRVFEKAGRPGWASIIPLYNIYILLKVAKRPGWWVILYFIPVVNLITSIVVAIDCAKAFGKSKAFGFFGLWLFSIIGFMILGFGDAKYKAIKR
jgi:uncharacterized membrane protein YhaH (DUF805 family)